MANGSTELITWMDHLWFARERRDPDPDVRPVDRPADGDRQAGRHVPAAGDRLLPAQRRRVRAVHPDRAARASPCCATRTTPTAATCPAARSIRFMDELSDLDLVVIDESFIDFVEAEPAPSVAMEAAIRPNVVVLKSLGKNFGLHGIRFGYLVANPGLAGKMRRHAAEVEPQLAGRDRRVHARRARRGVPGEPAAARPRPVRHGHAAAPACPELSVYSLAGELPAGEARGRARRHRRCGTT